MVFVGTAQYLIPRAAERQGMSVSPCRGTGEPSGQVVNLGAWNLKCRAGRPKHPFYAPPAEDQPAWRDHPWPWRHLCHGRVA